MVKCFFFNCYFTNTPSTSKHSLVQMVKCFFLQTVSSPIHQAHLNIPWYRLSYPILTNKWWNQKTVNNVLQKSLWNVLSKQIFTNTPSTYTHSLVQIAKCFSSNSYFTNTSFLGTDCKMFFFPTSYFTNTPFLGTDCKMFFSKQLFHQYTIPWYRL